MFDPKISQITENLRKTEPFLWRFYRCENDMSGVFLKKITARKWIYMTILYILMSYTLLINAQPFLGSRDALGIAAASFANGAERGREKIQRKARRQRRNAQKMKTESY